MCKICKHFNAIKMCVLEMCINTPLKRDNPFPWNEIWALNITHHLCSIKTNNLHFRFWCWFLNISTPNLSRCTFQALWKIQKYIWFHELVVQAFCMCECLSQVCRNPDLCSFWLRGANTGNTAWCMNTATGTAVGLKRAICWCFND